MMSIKTRRAIARLAGADFKAMVRETKAEIGNEMLADEAKTRRFQTVTNFKWGKDWNEIIFFLERGLKATRYWKPGTEWEAKQGVSQFWLEKEEPCSVSENAFVK